MPRDRYKQRYIAACGFSFVVMAASMTWAIRVGNEAAAIEHDLLHATVAARLLQAELDHLRAHPSGRAVKP